MICWGLHNPCGTASLRDYEVQELTHCFPLSAQRSDLFLLAPGREAACETAYLRINSHLELHTQEVAEFLNSRRLSVELRDSSI